MYIYTYLYSCGYPYARAINPRDKGWTISHANYIQHVYHQDGRHLTGLTSGPCAPCQHAHHSKSCAKSIGSGPCCKGISSWTNMETPDVFQWKFSSSSCLKNEETQFRIFHSKVQKVVAESNPPDKSAPQHFGFWREISGYNSWYGICVDFG